MKIASASDKELVERLQNGDVRALELLYSAYRQSLFESAYNLLRDKSLCEDILQDVFTDLWAKRTNRTIAGPVSNYLYTMVRYQVFSEIRKGTARPALYDNLVEKLNPSFSEGTDMLEYKELKEALAAAVNSLPPRCREVYVLKKEMHLSQKEIASQLNISTKTVENQLLKSMKILRMSLRHFHSIFF